MQLERENIILDTDPRIRQKSEPVSLPLSGEDKELLEAMVQYVKDSQDEAQAEQRGLQPAIGIAAIQLGIPKQMLAVYLPDEDGVHQAALANPKIISKSVQNSYLENGEGCLSVPGEHPGHVFRHARIKVRAYDLYKEEQIVLEAEGYFAIALQHEIDHLSGILYYDRIDPNNPWKEDREAEVI